MSILRRVANGASALVIACSSLMTLAFPLTAHAAVQTCTWNGEDLVVIQSLTAPEINHFSTPANWLNCNDDVPQAGDIIRFDNAGVPAAPADGVAPTVLTNDLDVALGGVETYLSVADPYYVNVDTLEFADGAYFEATNAPAQTGSRLNLVVGTVSSGQTNVSYGAVTGLGSLDLKNDGLRYSTLAVGGALSAGDGVYLDNATFNGTLTLKNGSGLSIRPTTATTNVAYPIVIGGGSGTAVPSIYVQAFQTYDSASKKWNNASSTVTFSGALTLNSDLDVTADSWSNLTTVKFTGAVTGTGKITRNVASVGTLITQAGELKNPVTTTALDGDVVSNGGYVPGAYVTVEQNETATLNGKRDGANVKAGAILKGTGTIINQLDVFIGGTVAPGNSPGCLTSDTLSLAGIYLFELGGTDPCTGYDQLKVLNATNVADAVTLDAATATLTTSLYEGYAPTKDQVFVIIEQGGDKAVAGTFKDLPEGATFEQNGIVFKISYVGGTGNDVTLTVMSVPAVPDTGFSFASAQPAIILAVMTVLSGAIVLTARRMNAFSTKK